MKSAISYDVNKSKFCYFRTFDLNYSTYDRFRSMLLQIPSNLSNITNYRQIRASRANITGNADWFKSKLKDNMIEDKTNLGEEKKSYVVAERCAWLCDASETVTIYGRLIKASDNISFTVILMENE